VNALRGWLRKRLADTLAKRLFLLMWVALVVSHLVAFAVINLALGMGGSAARPPPFPSLPPGPSVLQGGPQGMRQPGGGEPRPLDPFDLGGPDRRWGERQDDFMEGPGNGPGRLDQGGGPRHGFSLPTEYLLLDYGIRLLIIALAAALGARWVARPMADLVKASRELGPALDSAQQRLPLLDEHEGTVEVREAAHVFNTMAQRLKRQFVERGLMVAAISHDLRTPLTRLRMRLETMDIAPEARERSVDDVREMNVLIDSVLELFRGEGPGAQEALQALDLSALVQALADDRIEQGQPVTLRGDEPPVQARVQPLALRRVLDNLIANALRYGGRADISMGRDASGAWVRIADAGPGIPQAQLEEVFQPFYRLEGSRNRHTGGAGLGLYIARELTRRQGGELHLSNRAEGGLLAELRLP
jgi:signal transduction histidine kinase